MSTATIFADDDSTNQYLTSKDASYSVARIGGSITVSNGRYKVGQETSKFEVHESFMSFDITDVRGESISSALYYAMWKSDQAATDFVIEAREGDAWATAGAMASGDWVAGDELASKSLLASINTSNYSTDVYQLFTSEDAFKSKLSSASSDTYYIILCSKEQTDNSEPTGNEKVEFRQPNPSSDTQTPYLSITYTPPPVDQNHTWFHF